MLLKISYKHQSRSCDIQLHCIAPSDRAGANNVIITTAHTCFLPRHSSRLCFQDGGHPREAPDQAPPQEAPPGLRAGRPNCPLGAPDR